MSDRLDHPEDEHPPLRLFLHSRTGEGQQREYHRTSTRRTVLVRLAEGAEPVVADLLDLSPTGLRLALPQLPGQEGELQVEVLPGRWRIAFVRWTNTDQDHPIVGAEWRNPLTFEEVWEIRSFG